MLATGKTQPRDVRDIKVGDRFRWLDEVYEVKRKRKDYSGLYRIAIGKRDALLLEGRQILFVFPREASAGNTKRPRRRSAAAAGK